MFSLTFKPIAAEENPRVSLVTLFKNLTTKIGRFLLLAITTICFTNIIGSIFESSKMQERLFFSKERVTALIPKIIRFLK